MGPSESIQGADMSLSVVDSFHNQVKKIFQRDEIVLDNLIFKLHKTYNFVIITVGIIFITSQNYFSDNAITCVGEDMDSYVRNYCFLHGSPHIPPSLQAQLSPRETRCTSEQHENSEVSKMRSTNYYIWLPFILTICAVITLLPNILWKNIFERGSMKKWCSDIKTETEYSIKEDLIRKTATRFHKNILEKSFQSYLYNYGFAFCEILNLCAVVINRSILNTLFRGEFSDYGDKAKEYFAFEYDPVNAPSDYGPRNPLCHLFPTEVSCSVHLGAITGKTDVTNTLCLLSINVFNQYFFLILWWWWVILISFSCLGLLYRISQIAIGAIGKRRLSLVLNMLAVGEKSQLKVENMNLSPTQVFLLTRLVFNLKGSEVTTLIEAIPNGGNNTDDYSVEKKVTILKRKM